MLSCFLDPNITFLVYGSFGSHGSHFLTEICTKSWMPVRSKSPSTFTQAEVHPRRPCTLVTLSPSSSPSEFFLIELSTLAEESNRNIVIHKTILKRILLKNKIMIVPQINFFPPIIIICRFKPIPLWQMVAGCI